MEDRSLKYTTFYAMLWSLVEKAGQQLLALLFGISIARIIEPEDFGLIGLLMVFVTLSNVLQDGALSAALIRKKECKPIDYSTVFVTNISISILLYILLFLSAPMIANHYGKPILTPIARVLFLSFICNATGVVQYTHILKRLQFRKNTKISLIAVSTAGTIALIMALNGWGVWSLCTQIVATAAIRSLLLWVWGEWKISVKYQWATLKEHLPYSYKLLLTNTMNLFCAGIYPNVIGKSFSIAQAGLYTQANKFQAIGVDTLSNGLNQVAFPLLSSLENHPERRQRVYAKLVRVTSFVSFPLLLTLALVSKPLIITLLSDKWAEAGLILQLLALSALFYPLALIGGSLLKSVGNTKAILWLEGGRNILSLLLLMITCQVSLAAVIIGLIGVNTIYYVSINLTVARAIGYSPIKQISDMVPYLIISLLVTTPLYYWSPTPDRPWSTLLIQGSIAISGYLLLVWMSGSKVFRDVVSLIHNK